ncbi:hypothetical protein GOP47_0030309 [Adiantum capillus-veneris]|nr:hypothetical protein GOP47_0030309 [Adiantum capillus-veneris]
MTNLPLRLEGSFEQWWFVAPIDWAAANGHTEVVKELLRMDPSLLHNLTSKRQMRHLERLWNDQDAFSDAAIGRSKVVKDLLREFLIGQKLPNGKEDDACIHESKADDLGQLIAHGLFKAGYSVWVLYIAAAAGDEGLVNQMITTNPELIKGDGEFGLSDLLYAAARGRNVHIFQKILTLAKRVKASHINGKSGEASPTVADDDDKNLISTNELDYVGLSYNNRTIQSKALLAAARAGNVDMVRELLQDSSTHATVLSFRDSNGTTALHAAAGRGHLEVVKLILELCPSSVHGQDAKGNTTLHTAARRGCLQVATELMRFDKELIYIRNKNGETPLHLGVMGSKQPLPKLVMKQGGQIEVVKQIMVCNNNSMKEYVNWKTNEGHTALHLSVMSPRIDDKIVALLLQSPGIHVLEPDKMGSTALDLAQACRDSFPAAEFRCNIAISLLNAAISSSSATAAAGCLSTGPGSAAISVDLADPLMCSFSHDIAIPSDADSRRSSGRRNFARRSLSTDWTMDFQTSIASKGAPATVDTNAVDRQQVETPTLPDEGTLSRNLAVLRQTSLGIFETRRGATTIGSPLPVQCLSSLQSLFSSSTFRRVTLSGASEWAPISEGKKWNKFRKCMSEQNGSPQPLRQQFSSTANALFHPNTPMESLELRQEAPAPSISVSPFASPTGSTDQSPTFNSPSYIKSWLKGAMQAPSSSSSQRSTRKRMKKRLKQIANLTHLSFSSASETHSIHENDAYPNLRRRLVAHDGGTADGLNAHELGTPLIQDRLSRQSSMDSYMDCYHPCFCLDNWCQDGERSTKLPTMEGKTHARTVSEVASSSAANVISTGLIGRSQSSRSYKPIESPTASDQASTPAKHGHLQGPNASPRRSGGSSPTISPRPSTSLSLSSWLSPSLRTARKEKEVVAETTAKDGNSDEAEVSPSLKESENASQSKVACKDASAEGIQEDHSARGRDSSAGAVSQQSKEPARQESFRFCVCGPCFQDGDVHGSGERQPHTRVRGRQRVYHT